MEEIKAMDLESKDLIAERIEQIKVLFPEIAVEGDGSIDFDKLRLILGDEVEEGDERYAFTWPGKASAIRQSQAVSSATLRPCPEESVDWDTTQNLYVEGDNLEVLKLLQRGYHGKIKMIYIDPPYNTGHDFVYKDDFGDSIEHYRKQTGLDNQSNADTSGRFHSDWCSMMYARLKIARELLSDDGLLFMSIDENEVVNLRRIADEIFGEINRIAQIVTIANPGGRDYGQIAVMHEYVLVYTKNCGDVKQLPTERDYQLKDSRGGYEARELRNRNPKFNRSNRPNLFYPFYADPNNVDEYGYCSVSLERDETHTVEVFPLNAELKESCWRWGMDKARKAINNDPSLSDVVAKQVSSGKWNVYEKSRLSTSKAKSVWSETAMRTEDGTRQTNALFPEAPGVFDHPKSVDLIKRCIQLAADEGDIVLDFFSGSSTTAHAVMQLNAETGDGLRYIMCQLPAKCPPDSIAAQSGYETLCDVAKERIKRASKAIRAAIEESNKQLKIGEEPTSVPDFGFRVLKLDDSGIVRPEPGQLLLERIKPDRSDLDIVFEMMLKWGLELTYPIEKMDIAGYEYYSVAGDTLICCMKPGLTVQTLNEIAELEPDRVLILDSILDDTLKLNALQIFKRVEERTQKKIDLRTV